MKVNVKVINRNPAAVVSSMLYSLGSGMRLSEVGNKLKGNYSRHSDL